MSMIASGLVKFWMGYESEKALADLDPDLWKFSLMQLTALKQ
jgi:hypothetical protein